MNLNTLAKLSGVSVATVSKAFSGSSEISEETKKRIFELAKIHGVYDRYNKNKFDKKVIAVICPELKSDYYNNYLTLLDKEISDRNGIMTVSVTDFCAEREAELFAYYSSYCKADGIITINQRSVIKNTMHMPAVSIFPSAECADIDSISSNASDAIADAVEYLKSQGHTEIGFVGELLTRGKYDLVGKALKNAGLTFKESYFKVSTSRFEKAGIEVMDKWIADGDRLPTAIFAAYDNIAIGIIKSLVNAGYRVPDDISIIGMDDIPVINYLETPISSISYNASYACSTASELIMKKIENHYYQGRHLTVVPTKFVIRGSTGKAKKSE